MPITALYASLLAVLFIVLAVRVIRKRRGAKVAVATRYCCGHVGARQFCRICPFALLLLALAESLHTWPWLMHMMGLALVAGRVSRAYGVLQVPENFRFRVFGMAATSP